MLTGAVTAELETALWAQATVTNPVDLAGAGEQDVASYARGVALLLASDQVDGVLLTGYFGGYSTEESDLTEPELAAARQMAEAVAAQDKPLVVQTIYPTSPASQVLRAAGIPVHRDVDRACAVLAGLVERDDGRAGAGAAGPGAAGHRHVVRRGAGAVRRGRGRLPGRGVGDRPGRAGGRPRRGRPPRRAQGDRAAAQVRGRGSGGRPGGPRRRRAAYDDLVARLAPPAVSVEAMADLPTASS